MRRLIVLAVVLAACAGGVQESMTTSTTPATSTTRASVASTTSQPSAPGQDRELAPDFTLELADGGSFTLSEGDNPVYLVFWAEWCPVCRKELPIVDEIAAEYVDQVDFIAPVWRSVPESAEEAAAELMPSGAIRWGLDNEEVIFGLYGVPYQPVTILIAGDGTVFDQWAGVRKADEIRAALDGVIAITEG